MEDTRYLNEMLIPSAKQSTERVHKIGVILLMSFLGIAMGYVAATQLNIREERARRVRELNAGPYVQTAPSMRSGRERILKELGETRPYAFATLYAKLSGYLSEVLVDKGDHVRKGQILATIQSPETVSQYESAVADEKNKRAEAERMKELWKSQAATDADRDQAVAAADMATAKVKQLSAMKGYTTINAPFDGTVTARFADPGALVDSASAQSGALPIVTVSQVERLRVTTYIDQRDAPLVQVGDPAIITLTERPGVQFEARVTRKAGELDTRSRTMLTEIEIDNPRGELLSGGFVDVAIRVRAPELIQVPSQALVMRGNNAFVLVVAHDGTVHYKPVKIAENDGTTASLLSGIDENESVVLSMGNSLIEGEHVQISNDSK